MVPISKPRILVDVEAHSFTRIKWNNSRENTMCDMESTIAFIIKFFFIGRQVLFNLLIVRRVPALVHQNLFMRNLNSHAKIQR